jgi:hypothetical protein
VTAAPDPRFRDQLDPLMPPHADWCHGETHGACCGSECDCGVAESLDRIAAHVEAEVQAALNDAAADLEYRAGKVSPDVATGFLGAAGRVREIVTELNTSAEGEQPKERPPR